MSGHANLRAVLLCLCVALCEIARAQAAAAPLVDSSEIAHFELPSNGQLSDFLAQSVSWYRNVSTDQQLATDPPVRNDDWAGTHEFVGTMVWQSRTAVVFPGSVENLGNRRVLFPVL